MKTLTPSLEPSTDWTVRRILIAEDNVVNQRVVVRMLERSGYRVDAATGVKAVDRCLHPVDLVRSAGDVGAGLPRTALSSPSGNLGEHAVTLSRMGR